MPYAIDTLTRLLIACDTAAHGDGISAPIRVYLNGEFVRYRKADPTPKMDPAAAWMFNEKGE